MLSRKDKAKIILKKVSPFQDQNIIVKITIGCVLVSFFALLLLLLASLSPNGVYLSKFTLDSGLADILQHSSFKFGIFGHCVDSSCTSPSLYTEFHIMPNFQDGGNSKRDIFDDAKNGIQNGFDDAKNAALSELKKAFLAAMQAFTPKHDTVRFANLFAMPYVISFVFVLAAIVVLRFGIASVSLLLVMVATVTNGLAFVFDLLLFVWVFDLVALIPGIGHETTGAAIYLAGISSFSLLIACGLLYANLCCCGPVCGTIAAVYKTKQLAGKAIEMSKVSPEQKV